MNQTKGTTVVLSEVRLGGFGGAFVSIELGVILERFCLKWEELLEGDGVWFLLLILTKWFGNLTGVLSACGIAGGCPRTLLIDCDDFWIEIGVRMLKFFWFCGLMRLLVVSMVGVIGVMFGLQWDDFRFLNCFRGVDGEDERLRFLGSIDAWYFNWFGEDAFKRLNSNDIQLFPRLFSKFYGILETFYCNTINFKSYIIHFLIR